MAAFAVHIAMHILAMVVSAISFLIVKIAKAISLTGMAFFSQAITLLQTIVVALGAGLGVWGVINLLDPEVIVLGGGVSKAGNYLLDPLVREFPQYVLFNDQPLPSVKIAVLGSEAGIIGASMLS